MNAVRPGPGVQEIFTSMRRGKLVTIHAVLAVRTHGISEGAALPKERCSKIHVVVTRTILAGMELKKLLNVRVTYSITVPYAAATVHVEVAVPNYFPESQNVVPLPVASRNHNAQPQRILYSCRTPAMVNISTSVSTVFCLAIVVPCNSDGTQTRTPVTKHTVLKHETFPLYDGPKRFSLH